MPARTLRSLLTALAVMAVSACGQSDVTSGPAAGSKKELTSFDILAMDNLGLASDVTGVISEMNITLAVPAGTNLTRLVPTITQTGASVSPASGIPHDFTNPSSYRVTAADGSIRTYAVTITAALRNSKDITRFSILGIDGVIGSGTVALTLPSGTNLTGLTPTIAQTGASVSPASGVPHDFTQPASYAVTASDGSTRVYRVTVIVAAGSSKDITQFSIQGVNGVVSGTSITLTLPNGTNVTALVPTIVQTGTSVSPASGVAHDFTNPANYTVTAADGSAKTYLVSVTVTPPIDLNTATIVEGSAGDIATWPQTATITAVNINGTAISVDFDKKDNANRWPDECDLPGFVGCPGLQYTVWLFENIGGQWYGTGSVEMWYGRPDTGANPAGGTIQDQIRLNWIYYSAVMSSHVLGSGEQVGIMVTGGDERRKDNTDVRERSNVVLVTLP